MSPGRSRVLEQPHGFAHHPSDVKSKASIIAGMSLDSIPISKRQCLQVKTSATRRHTQAHNWASAVFTAWGTALLLAVMFSRWLHGLVSKLAHQPGTGEELKCEYSGVSEACRSTAACAADEAP